MCLSNCCLAQKLAVEQAKSGDTIRPSDRRRQLQEKMLQQGQQGGPPGQYGRGADFARGSSGGWGGGQSGAQPRDGGYGYVLCADVLRLAICSSMMQSACDDMLACTLTHMRNARCTDLHAGCCSNKLDHDHLPAQCAAKAAAIRPGTMRDHTRAPAALAMGGGNLRMGSAVRASMVPGLPGEIQAGEAQEMVGSAAAAVTKRSLRAPTLAVRCLVTPDCSGMQLPDGHVHSYRVYQQTPSAGHVVRVCASVHLFPCAL